MVNIEKVDLSSQRSVNQFVDFPYRMYKGHPQWVPPFRMDIRDMLNPKKHPYYEHSDAEFFVARQGKDIVGRIAALQNNAYNNFHGKKVANFYLYDVLDDQAISDALFATVGDWARRRGMDTLIGPKGFGPLDGYGILIDGFEHRQMMNMMNYNYPYYSQHVEQVGMQKEVDFISAFIEANKFEMPERIHRIAERARKASKLEIKRFSSKRELVSWSDRIGKAYNKAFVNNWEYAPFTEAEIKFVVDAIMVVADHRLIKIITHGEDIVGFLFAFPDVSAAMQRHHGNLLPFGIVDLLLEMRRTKWVALNGAGILPEFQGRGGNALLYSEMVKTMSDYSFTYADLTQVADTAVQMRNDLTNLGGKAYKTHRVYHMKL